MNFQLKPIDRMPYTRIELNSPIQLRYWPERVTSSCMIWLKHEECTRTRFEYLLKFKFQLQPLLGGCEGQAGRKEQCLPSNLTTSCVLTVKECHIQKRKLELCTTARVFLNQNKANLESLLVRRATIVQTSHSKPLFPSTFQIKYQGSRFLTSHSHQNTQHFQLIITPADDHSTRSVGCTASKPVSFSDKLHQRFISFGVEAGTSLK